MKEKMLEKINSAKEVCKETCTDVIDFSEDHPVLAGHILGCVMIAWVLIIQGWTVHFNDELKWVRK